MWPYQTPEAVEQNLRDAGCGEECIRQFMEDLGESKAKEALKLLEAHRRTLLDAMHRDLKRIDCLDYLVYQMERAHK